MSPLALMTGWNWLSTATCGRQPGSFFFIGLFFLLAFFYWPTARKSWREAEIHCNSFGGHLASVPNMEVNNLIQSRVKKNDPKTHFWLGGRKKEGDWSWSDESRSNFTRWLWSGSGKKEQCLQILESGGWNDLPCNYHRQFVCGQRISLGEHSVPIQNNFFQTHTLPLLTQLRPTT